MKRKSHFSHRGMALEAFKENSCMSTETTVTFLNYDPTTQLYTPELRVFQLEISSQAQTTYTAYMNLLQLYISQMASGSATAEQNMPKIADLLANLNKWSEAMYVSGGNQIDQTTSSSTVTIEDPTNPGSTIALNQLGTMDRYMAADVDKLIRTFRAGGYDPVTNNFLTSGATFSSVADNLFVTNASLYDVNGTLSDALNVAAQSRISTDVWTQSQSIQQLLMVDYISRGNELLYSEMSQLNDAINVNQNALSYLNSLQDLMNQKDPQHFVMALQDLSGDVGGDTSTTYSDFEKATFNQELQNVAKFSDSDIETYLSGLLGLSPTATPTASQTAGAALGAFQALGDSAMDPSLQTYLSSQGVTATMASLLPVLADNDTYNTKMSTFVANQSLTSSDAELIWRVFLINEAGLTALPSSVDLTTSTTLSDFTTFLANLGSQAPTSATLPALLQNTFTSYITQKYTSLLLSNAGVSDVSQLSSLFPPAVAPWSQSRTIIDNAFSSFNLSENSKLLIMQAFLTQRGQTLGVSPDAIDMTLQSNLNALSSFVGQVTSLLNPKTVLTNSLLQDANISSISDFDSLYPPVLASFPSNILQIIDTNFPTANNSWVPTTETDKLNMLRAFLLQQAKTTGQNPQDIDMTLSANQQAFALYVGSQNSFFYSGINSQNDFYTHLLSSISGGLSNFPSYQDLNDLYPPSLTQPQWSSVPFDSIFSGFTSFTLSDTEKLNMVRVFLTQQNPTDPQSVDLTDSTVQSNLQSYVNSLNTYTLNLTQYPMDLPTLQATLTSQISNYPSVLITLLGDQYPSDLKDWSQAKAVVESNFSLFTLSDPEKLNIIRAFLVKQGGTPQSIDMTSSANLAALATYVSGLSNQASQYQAILSNYVGEPLTGAYPPNIEPWDTAEAIVKSAFTAFTPTDTDVLNIIRSFLVMRAQALSITPDAVDLTSASNLSALETYVFQLSSSSKVLPVSYLTTVPSLSLNLYQPLLTKYFPSLSAGDQLTLWKGFLIDQGYTDNSSVTVADSTVRVSFEQYLQNVQGYVGSATGQDLATSVYAYLYAQQQKSLSTLYLSRYASNLVDNTITTPSDAYTVLSGVFSAADGYTVTDINNVWKAYLAKKGTVTALDTNDLTLFATQIKGIVGSSKGAELANLLKEGLSLYDRVYLARVRCRTARHHTKLERSKYWISAIYRYSSSYCCRNG